MAEGYTAGMVKHSLRDFSPEAGFEYRMPEKIDPAVARFDITGCPYHAMCEKYDCGRGASLQGSGHA